MNKTKLVGMLCLMLLMGSIAVSAGTNVGNVEVNRKNYIPSKYITLNTLSNQIDEKCVRVSPNNKTMKDWCSKYAPRRISVAFGRACPAKDDYGKALCARAKKLFKGGR